MPAYSSSTNTSQTTIVTMYHRSCLACRELRLSGVGIGVDVGIDIGTGTSTRMRSPICCPSQWPDNTRTVPIIRRLRRCALDMAQSNTGTQAREWRRVRSRTLRGFGITTPLATSLKRRATPFQGYPRCHRTFKTASWIPATERSAMGQQLHLQKNITDTRTAVQISGIFLSMG